MRITDTENRLYEAGHYYKSHGPTMWSNIGASIALERKASSDKTLLFIDDVHTVDNLNGLERMQPIIEFTHSFDYMVLESEMVDPAKIILEQLFLLPRSKRAKMNPDGKCFCSGFPITTVGGQPLCVLLDATLTKHKYDLGFRKIINVLPGYYEEEQEHVSRLLQKILPNDFHFSVIYFDAEGNTREVKYQEKVTHSMNMAKTG